MRFTGDPPFPEKRVHIPRLGRWSGGRKLRRMGDILDKKVGQPRSAGGGTKAQAGNTAQVARGGRQLEGAPNTEAQEMSLSTLVGQGFARRVMVKRARVSANKIIKAPQEEDNQKNQSLARPRSFSFHSVRSILSKSRRTGKAPRPDGRFSSLAGQPVFDLSRAGADGTGCRLFLDNRSEGPVSKTAPLAFFFNPTLSAIM